MLDMLVVWMPMLALRARWLFCLYWLAAYTGYVS
jgi:hypothetical protein